MSNVFWSATPLLRLLLLAAELLGTDTNNVASIDAKRRFFFNDSKLSVEHKKSKKKHKSTFNAQ